MSGSCLRVFNILAESSPLANQAAAQIRSCNIGKDSIHLHINHSVVTPQNAIPAIAHHFGLPADYVGVGYFAKSPIDDSSNFVVVQGEAAAT